MYGHKEIYMKATFLACSFAGITFVPIDESTPKERIDLIIEQVNPYCIFGDFQSKQCKNISKQQIYKLMENKIFDFSSIFKQLKQNNATIAIMTPSFADLLLIDKTFSKEILPKLKTIVFCGETLLKTTIQKLYSRFLNIKIINCYGPTECTFAVTSVEITKEILKQENIPIGKPKTDVEIIIVDEDKKPLSDNQVGEILIIGESVANGYLGEVKEQTFIYYNGKRAYLTGDLGYWNNGNLYYKCRKDKQIKYKGYRIEIADIEKIFTI